MTYSKLILTALALGVFVGRAEALYLDPTTGSIAFQVAIGGLLAAATAARIYWRRIKSALKLLPGFRRSP